MMAIYLIKKLLEIIIPLFYVACATTIFSLGAFVGIVLKFYKELAEAGLKINYRTLDKQNGQEKANKNAMTLKNILLTLGLNIYYIFRLTYFYQDFKENIYQEFAQAIEKMTPWEQKQYLKHPSGLRAFNLMKKWSLDDSPLLKIYVKEDEGISQADFYLREDETVDIIDVKGPLAKRNNDEQEDYIIGLFMVLYMEGIKKYSKQEELALFLNSLADENNTYYFDLREEVPEEEIVASQVLDLDETLKLDDVTKDEEIHEDQKLKLTRKKKEKFNQ